MTSSERNQNKYNAIRRRIFLYGRMGDSCPCDICRENPATDMHEIINKDRVHDPEQRLFSEVEELCSLLCQNCHMNKAPGMKRFLLEKNVSIYGYNSVKAAFYRIEEKYRRGITFDISD